MTAAHAAASEVQAEADRIYQMAAEDHLSQAAKALAVLKAYQGNPAQQEAMAEMAQVHAIMAIAKHIVREHGT